MRLDGAAGIVQGNLCSTPARKSQRPPRQPAVYPHPLSLSTLPQLVGAAFGHETKQNETTPTRSTQVFKLYVFSRSVHSFGETLDTHLDAEDAGGDEETAKLVKDKFVKAFAKLAEGFSRFLQVRTPVLGLISRRFCGRRCPLLCRSLPVERGAR